MRVQDSGSDRKVEFLAEEFHVPVEVVATLYERECAELALQARVTSYLPIFAIRNVRGILGELGSGTDGGEDAGAPASPLRAG